MRLSAFVSTAINLRVASTATVLLGLGALTVLTAPAHAQAYTYSNLVDLNTLPGGVSTGIYPLAGLISDASGNLYGTTSAGGTDHGVGNGVVFELTKTTGGFTYSNIADLGALPASVNPGVSPVASLTFDASGNLYGTTSAGGTNFNGTVFELTKTSSGYTYSTLADMGAISGAGYNPSSNLLVDASGNLFGTAEYGGTGSNASAFSGSGTIFELTKTANGYSYSNIVDLGALPASAHAGQTPYAGMISDASGNLYGTTYGGGVGNKGTVFKLTNTGSGYTYSNLVDLFTLPTSANAGYNPQGGLVMDASGNLYGTTIFGGTANDGTIFKLTKSGSGYTYSNLADLGALPDSVSPGHNPLASLILDASGDLYGTTQYGGTGTHINGGYGTAFELVKNGSGYTYRNLADFGAIVNGGHSPQAGLILDTNGNLYGTAEAGGASNGGFGNGVIYKLTPNITASPAPEASSLALALFGFSVGGLVVRRRRKA